MKACTVIWTIIETTLFTAFLVSLIALPIAIAMDL